MPTVTQEAIARKLGIDRTTVSKVLNNSTTHYVGSKTRQRILSIARKLGYDLTRLRKRAKQPAGQLRVQIEAEAEIQTWEGQRHASGQVTISSLSRRGAELKNLRIDPPTVPLKPCKMQLRFTAPASAGGGNGSGGAAVELTGHIHRLETGGLVELEVEFSDLPDGAGQVLDQILLAASRQHPEAEA